MSGGRAKMFSLLKILKNEDGVTMVVAVAIFVVVLGCTALVADVGMAYISEQKLTNAVDAVALAAIQDINISHQQAITTAENYMAHNGYHAEDISVMIGSDNKSVEVFGTDSVDFYFAKIFGYDGTEVNAKSKAVVLPITGISGVRPFAIEDFPLQYGVQYVLKEGAGDSYHGNFGVVALGGSGASVYRNNIKYGYSGTLRVGDWIDTETGNMPSPTQEGIDFLMNQCDHAPKCTFNLYDPACARIIPVPIVDTLQVDGRKDVQIIGFAMFLIEGTTMSGGHLDVIGRFIKYYGDGEMEQGGRDFGLYAAKLVE